MNAVNPLWCACGKWPLVACVVLALHSQTTQAFSGDTEKAAAWLLDQPYFRDLIASVPERCEVFASGTQEDPKISGFYITTVKKYDPEVGKALDEGIFRFSPADKIIKQRNWENGYYEDLAQQRGGEVPPDKRSSPAVDFLLAVAQGPPAAPSSTPARQNDNRADQRAAPTATPKAQPMYGVRMDGGQIACFNLESGSTVTKVRAPSGIVVGGPSFSGDRAVVTVQKGNVRTTYIYKMPSMSTVTKTTDVQ